MNTSCLHRHCAVVVGASVTLAAFAAPVSAAILYSNDFNTSTLTASTGTMAAGSTTFTQSTPTPADPFVAQGVGDFALSVSDTDATLGRGHIGFRFGGTGPADPILTFSFTLDGPLSGVVLMRADNQTNNTIASSTLVIAGTQTLGSVLGTASATASKTVFFLLNQGTTNTTYVSPVNSATITLQGGTLDYYYRDNETGTYTQITQDRAFIDRNGATAGYGELNKWVFGNSSNTDVNAFTVDDLLLESGINENFVPEPSSLAVAAFGALLALRRRRPA